MSSKSITSNKSRNPIFEKNFFYDLPPELRKNIEDKTIKFFETPVTYDDFFKANNLYRYEGNKSDKDFVEIILTGKNGGGASLFTRDNNIYYTHNNTDDNPKDCKTNILLYKNNKTQKYGNDVITSLIIKYYKSQEVILDINVKNTNGGGRKAPVVKKEINGKLRCIYKIAGSRKEHLKYKGRLITVADYKKLMKNNVIIRKLFGGDIKEIIQKKTKDLSPSEKEQMFQMYINSYTGGGANIMV